MNPGTRLVVLCLATAVAAFSLGCAKRDDPDARLRARISKAEQAVEKKEIAELRDYVSDRYTDEDGRDRRAVDALLRVYLLRNDSIHLLTRIASISFPQPTQAKVVLYVAMAGRPIPAGADLNTFNANLYRFDLEFADESKQWRVTRAVWRPAEPADFVHQ